jgi:hypothetical protein
VGVRVRVAVSDEKRRREEKAVATASWRRILGKKKKKLITTACRLFKRLNAMTSMRKGVRVVCHDKNLALHSDFDCINFLIIFSLSI